MSKNWFDDNMIQLQDIIHDAYNNKKGKKISDRKVFK